jgi:general secretion pathway protein N
VLIRLLAATLTALLTVVVFAPAAWVGDVVQSASPVRLLYAEGTVWRGSAMLAFSDGQRARLVPGRLTWRVTWDALLSGRIAITLHHPIFQPSLNVFTDFRSVEVTPGAARLPAALLEAAGMPFNTARFGGRLHASWDAVRIAPGAFAGLVQLDWEDAQSALSPVVPLGNYRLTLLGRGPAAELRLATLKGPLLLQGEGRFQDGRGRFQGSAAAEPAMADSLRGLIGVLGQRTGDRAVLAWEL